VKVYCRCGFYLGEIVKGSKLHKDIVYLCGECMKKYETYEGLANYEKSTSPNKGGNFEDLFGGLFGKKGEVAVGLGVCIFLLVVTLLASIKVIRDDMKESNVVTNVVKSCTE